MANPPRDEQPSGWHAAEPARGPRASRRGFDKTRPKDEPTKPTLLLLPGDANPEEEQAFLDDLEKVRFSFHQSSGLQTWRGHHRQGLYLDLVQPCGTRSVQGRRARRRTGTDPERPRPAGREDEKEAMNLDGLSAREISDPILLRAEHRPKRFARWGWTALSVLMWLTLIGGASLTLTSEHDRAYLLAVFAFLLVQFAFDVVVFLRLTR
jgi:hypothetical protein